MEPRSLFFTTVFSLRIVNLEGVAADHPAHLSVFEYDSVGLSKKSSEKLYKGISSSDSRLQPS